MAANPPCHEAPQPGPDERSVLDLNAAELFVVGALRAWVAPHMRPGEAHPDWREMFRLMRVPGEGAVGFELMMSVIGAHAQRLLEVSCCRCPGLGADEAHMLRLVAALQRAEPLAALDVLSDWLPPGAVAPALRGAQRFATQMAAAGLRLPQPPPGDWVPTRAGGFTLH